jgi:hypothetical protein
MPRRGRVAARARVFALAALGLGALPAPAGAVSRARAYAVTTTNQLISFETISPGTIDRAVAVSGLQPGEDLLGLDQRPRTGEWYALGSTGRLYRLDVVTGAATPVGAGPFGALSGLSFGFDFSPVTDRIRVVSDFGQNLRLNPDTGTLASTDSTLNGATSSLVAAAHSDSYAGATLTTLYGIDSQTDALYTLDPPANGATMAVGPLGIDVVALAGFDIETGSGIGYAVLGPPPGSTSELYAVSLATGTATLAGIVGGGHVVRAFGVATSVLPMVVLAAGNQLHRFSSATGLGFQSTVTVAGVVPGESLVAIDVRPANHGLYGLGDLGRLYAIDLAGAATAVTPAPLALSGTQFGFDFSAVVDRIRVTSDTGQNARIHPDTGALITDTGINGAVTGIADAAYTNSFAGALTTTLYGIDGATRRLVLVNPPNGGVTATVGMVPLLFAPRGFDIEPRWGKGFVAGQVGGIPHLYEVDLATAALWSMGVFPTFDVRDIAVLSDVIFSDGFE